MGKDGIMGGDDNKQAKIARSRRRSLEKEIEQLRAENQRLKEVGSFKVIETTSLLEELRAVREIVREAYANPRDVDCGLCFNTINTQGRALTKLDVLIKEIENE